MDKQTIIKDLALKHGLSEKKVSQIVHSQFRFVRYVMEKGDAQGVRLRFFGKFDVHPTRLKKVIENAKGQGLTKKATDPSAY